MVVSLVAAGSLTLRNAIPIVMGANIGTTVTNTIVSMGHVTRKPEFERAFAAATVHDFFNIFAVLAIFPLEMIFGILEKSSSVLSRAFVGMGGVTLASPLKMATEPIVSWIKTLSPHPVALLLLALALLFFSLRRIVIFMRGMVSGKMSLLLDEYLFRNDLFAFALGLGFTSIVQSSSVTTSIVVPLVGAGLVSVQRIFPYTLGANMGTTVTAILASLATSSPVAVTVAFAHLLFNIAGILIFYPLRSLPIRCSMVFARAAARSKKNLILFLVVYFLLHFIPLTFVLLAK
jgi:sodium-dependent phosphate cotransporter